jgi:hypothetical protein
MEESEMRAMKKIALFLVLVLAFNNAALSLDCAPPESSQVVSAADHQADQIKAEVEKRGARKQSRVRVSLRDGTEIRGYISKVDERSFGLTDEKSGKLTTISYENVNKIKREGLSKPAKILIVSGVIFGALIVIGVAAACHMEGGPHC